MSDTSNLNLFDATVNIDSNEIVCSENFDSLFCEVLKIFSKFLIEGRFPGIDFLSFKGCRLSLCLYLIDDDEMIELNLKYRGRKKTTDVLSFPVQDDLRKGIDIGSLASGELILGDIFISAPVAMRQASEAKLTIEVELVELFIHGILHLMGYDHELSDKEKQVMYNLEEEIFDQYKEKK